MDDRDPEAFRALYRAHYRTVCRYLALRVEPELVEDVAAETFLVAWRKQLELPEHAVPWLLNVAAKCLANQRRSRIRSAALEQRLASARPAVGSHIEDDLTRGAQGRALAAALAAVSDADRELLILRHWDGLAPREIATVAGLNPTVARARLHRAQRRLQHALGAALADEDGGRRPVELLETSI